MEETASPINEYDRYQRRKLFAYLAAVFTPFIGAAVFYASNLCIEEFNVIFWPIVIISLAAFLFFSKEAIKANAWIASYQRNKYVGTVWKTPAGEFVKVLDADEHDKLLVEFSDGYQTELIPFNLEPISNKDIGSYWKKHANDYDTLLRKVSQYRWSTPDGYEGIVRNADIIDRPETGSATEHLALKIDDGDTINYRLESLKQLGPIPAPK